MVLPSPAVVLPSASAKSASSSWPWSRSRGVKSPAAVRSANFFRRRMRRVTDRDERKNAIAATTRRIPSRSRILSRVPGDAHSTAARIVATSARQISASRQERLTRKTDSLLLFGLAFVFEHVPRAAHGFQEGGMVGVALHFFAQAANIHIHAARRDEPLSAPDGVKQLIAREHAIRARREVVKQAKFECGKCHRLAVSRHPIRGRIY